VGRVRNAVEKQVAHERRGPKNPVRYPQRITTGPLLEVLHVFRRYVVVGDRIHENHSLDALGSGGGKPQGNSGAEVDADDRGARHAQCRERAIEVFGLGSDAEISVEGAIGFAVAEQVDGERGAIGERELRRDAAPEKTAGTEPVNEKNGGAAVSVSLHMHGARPHGNAQQIGVDGEPPRRIRV
jgi:hypothetical protein